MKKTGGFTSINSIFGVGGSTGLSKSLTRPKICDIESIDNYINMDNKTKTLKSYVKTASL